MTINSTTRKTNNLVGNGNTHTYPFPFKVFADSEIVVKKLEVATSVETTLTLGANNDYIVTLNQDQNGNPGGEITLKSGGNNFNLPSGFQIVITSAVQSLQGTDLTNQGGFYPEVINDALDKSAILHQQQQNELDRSIKFALTNTIGSLEITESATERANKVMAFDGSGELTLLNEIGTYRGNWAASRAYFVRDLVKDTSTNNIFMCNVAHTSSGAQPLTTNTDSAKWDLIVDAATATAAQASATSSASAAASSATAAAASQTAAASSQTAAASSATAAASSATTASTKATQADTAKTAAQAAQTAAETALDSFDDRYLGAKSSNPTLDNDGNALIDGALYFNTTVNRMRVYDLGNTTWLEVTIFGSDLTNVNTVAGSISNVNTVAGSITGVNAVANNATNINAVNSNATNINAVAGAVSNINAVASNATNINTVASNISNVNAIATDIAKIQTVANDLNETVSEIETAANDLNETTSEIDTVANAITNVDNVGNNISNVNTVAGIASNVTSVASNASNINTVANSITNVNNVGSNIANVNTVASNLSGVNAFAARYRTDNTGNNPSSDLDGGDLFYNQQSGKLLVYNANTSAWEETQSIGNFFINTIGSFSGTGGNSATFNNSAYKFTLSNAGQFAQQMLVSINGVVQKPNSGTGQPSEGFALDGANIVFSSPPPTGADYFIVTIGASVSIGTPSNDTITNAMVKANAAIAMSKLALSITNAEINASAAIAGTKISPDFGSQNIATTGTVGSGNITVTATDPTINFVDTNHNPDFRIQRSTTGLAIQDTTNSNATRFLVKANGDIDITGNLDAQGGVDVTGNITVTGTVDGVDIAALSATVSGLTTDLVSDTSPQLGGNLDVNDKNIIIGDSSGGSNNRIRIGDSNDFELFHNGTNSVITNANGQLILQAAAADVSIEPKYGEKGLICKPNGATELYHDAEIRFTTLSNGAATQKSGQVDFLIGSTDGSGAFLILDGDANGDGSGGDYSYLAMTTVGELDLVNNKNEDLRFGNNGTIRARFTTSGHFVPQANNTYDLGSNGARWQNIYTNDLNLSNEGSANDVDGTWGSFTIQEGAESLFLINKRNGKKYKFNLTEVA